MITERHTATSSRSSYVFTWLDCIRYHRGKDILR